MSSKLLVALVGQPNAGKSTLFNLNTGARQFVANYPGVTVDKKVGFFKIGELHVELADLPGTYSLTSFSLEERVACNFLLQEKPDLIVNVVDAANIKRNLYLTLQLLEMEIPLVLALNMMDVAVRRSITIDIEGLSTYLKVPVVPTTGKSKAGIAALHQAIESVPTLEANEPFRVDYAELEPAIETLSAYLAGNGEFAGIYPVRWLAIKLLENDSGIKELLSEAKGDCAELFAGVDALRAAFAAAHTQKAERHIAFMRHRVAAEISRRFVKNPKTSIKSYTEKIDNWVCGKISGPVILVAILFTLYQIALVFGGTLSTDVWPFWAWIINFISSLLPNAGFIEDPMLRSLCIWSMKSVGAVLNYLPIFFLLFALIAILEDSGYMPRMAFILDRIFRRYGLHGQSTLPLILGGVYVGGCAIPAVMATKAIPDEKARLATILIAPMMNCLAKVPLYLILITTYFAVQDGLAMFFISTVALFLALPVAKVLSLTLLKGKPSAPFIMEMPPYHLPSVLGVTVRTLERIWMFLKKIVTVVLAVSVVIFVLITFPGLDADRMAHYGERATGAIDAFLADVGSTNYAGQVSAEDVQRIIAFEETIRAAKIGVTQEQATRIDQRFKANNPIFFDIVRGETDDGKELRRSLRKVVSARKELRRTLREETFENSVLGTVSKAIEPVTRFAGFDWKVNIAIISAFAAKENSAATLGAIYSIDGDAESVQENLRAGALQFGPLHALALMMFMALSAPCIPAAIMVRVEANSTGWMLFSLLYQTVLALSVSILIFTGGTALGLSGWQAMWIFYGFCVALTLVTGLLPESKEVTEGNSCK